MKNKLLFIFKKEQATLSNHLIMKNKQNCNKSFVSQAGNSN